MIDQAIVTKFFGPGNVRGSRIKATASAGTVTIPYDDSKKSEENHIAAAKALAIKYNWSGGTWFVGSLPNDVGKCFVRVDHKFIADEQAAFTF